MLGLTLSALLAGCGGAGTKYHEFMPKRIVVIGDEITYVGCTQASADAPCLGTDSFDRYSINNVSSSPAAFVNNWVVQLATLYGLGLNQIVESSLKASLPAPASDAAKRRAYRLGATVDNIRAQAFNAGSIPAYAAGDMLILAGGANDVINIMKDPTNDNDISGITFERSLSPTVMINEAKVTHLSIGKAYRIMKAAQQYQNLAFDLLSLGQQHNVFVALVYDFSNSPDLNQFCPANLGCSQDGLQEAIKIFNLTLKNFTDANGNLYQFDLGKPRILTTTGYAVDASYTNLTMLTNTLGTSTYQWNPYSGSNPAASACGSTISASGDLTGCTWNGLLATASDGTPVATSSGMASDFISTSGRYIYASNFYLAPVMLLSIGNIFYTFMRGYYGW
jgi:hypothetical protein